MSYSLHLIALLKAHFAACPGQSARSVSLKAGLHANWVSDFQRRRAGHVRAMEAVVRSIADACPTGPQGDEVRRLLAVFDPVTPNAERDAA